jgi:hypothetical protein
MLAHLIKSVPVCHFNRKAPKLPTPSPFARSVRRPEDLPGLNFWPVAGLGIDSIDAVTVMIQPSLQSWKNRDQVRVDLFFRSLVVTEVLVTMDANV